MGLQAYQQTAQRTESPRALEYRLFGQVTRALMAAAESDGVSLSGSGYRDSSEQVALRQQNCGSSDYAIYDMSSSDCSPPTPTDETPLAQRPARPTASPKAGTP